MAQVVNVSPVQINDDGSSSRFISVLNSQIESRRRQEEAMRQSAIKQREDNMRLFGDGVKNLEKYNQLKILKGPIKNQIVQQELSNLASALNSGDAQIDVPLLMLKTSQTISNLDNVEKNVEAAKNRIKELYPSISEENIIGLANKYIYKQTQNPDGTITEDINWDNLPKMQDLILGEFASNPSRYANLPALTNSMSRVIGSIKTDVFEDKRRMDPTGTKLTSVGVKANKLPFEELIDITDPDTKLKTRVPGVKVVPFVGFKKPDGTLYNVVSDNTFNGLIANSDKSLPNMLNVKADSMIVDHNTEVIFNQIKSQGGLGEDDDEMALKDWAREQAVGANAQGSVELEKNFPGFVNKYIPSNMDAFVRIAATKALSDLGRYNPDGTINDVQYDRGEVRDNPRAAGGSGGGGGTAAAGTQTIDLSGYVKGYLGNRNAAPFNAMGSLYRTAVIDQAKSDAGVSNIGAGDIEMVKVAPTASQPAEVGYRFVRDIEDSSGNIVINKGTVFPLDPSTNVTVSKSVGGQRSATAAVRQNVGQSSTTTQAKTIKESDIAGAASRAGYTVKEYRTLLQQKGVRIIK